MAIFSLSSHGFPPCFCVLISSTVRTCVRAKSLQSCLTLCDSWTVTFQAPLSVGFSRQEYWSVLSCPPQGIFPTQGSNPGLPHCRQNLYHLSHQGSPRILERVTYPFSRGSSQPRNWTGVSCIAGRFFTSWSTREALNTSNILDYKWSNIRRASLTLYSFIPLFIHSFS